MAVKIVPYGSIYLKKTKIFLVQEEIAMTPDEMAEIFCGNHDLEVKIFSPHIRWHELDASAQSISLIGSREGW